MNKVLCARLLLPKVAIRPSAPTECQAVNWFSHITNKVSVEKATDMMTWTQKKQREKYQGKQLEEIEGDSVNDDGHLSSPKTETKARAAAFKEEEMRRVTGAAGYMEAGLFGS